MVVINFFINMPAYYTKQFGVIDEIYYMFKDISCCIDITNYTTKLDTIGITPIIAPKQVLNGEIWREEKRISLPYRMASVSLHLDYDAFYKADIEEKKIMLLNNIFDSLLVVKKRLKVDFNYLQMKEDINKIFNQSGDGSVIDNSSGD